MSTLELFRTVATLTDDEARALRRVLDERLAKLGPKPLAPGETYYDRTAEGAGEPSADAGTSSSLLDRIQDLVGAAHGPGDLSTNKTYLNDMGASSLS